MSSKYPVMFEMCEEWQEAYKDELTQSETEISSLHVEKEKFHFKETTIFFSTQLTEELAEYGGV